MTHDRIGLVIEIRYTGSVVPHPAGPTSAPASALPSGLDASDLDNEEAAAIIGLGSFIRCLAADRKHVVQRGGEVLVRLSYAV